MVPHRGWGRWFVVAPALGGVVLCAAGAVAAGQGHDGFLAYLGVIVGGWALAFAAVNALAGLAPRRQWVVHVALAVGAVALLATTTALLDALSGLPQPWRGPLLYVALGLPPAAGWVLLTLLGRVSNRIDRDVSRRAATLTPLAWSGSDSRPELTATASTFPRRRLTVLIVGAIAVGGLLATVVMILAERWVLRLPPLMLVVLLGVLIGLPLYAAVHAVVNHGRGPVTLRWGTGAVEIDAGTDARWVVPLAMIRRLVWCMQGDMARFEIHTATRRETFLVGMVRQDAGSASELPPLQHRMTRALEQAGLRSRVRRGVISFEREAGTISRDDARPGRG